jgi:hypothetical protein
MAKICWFYIEGADKHSGRFEQHEETWADGGNNGTVVKIEKPSHIRKLNKVARKGSKFLKTLQAGLKQSTEGKTEDLGTFRERA